MLGAVVDQGDAAFFFSLSGAGILFIAGDRGYGVLHGEGTDRAEIRRHFVADHSVHNALLPGDADDLPGIHAAQAGDAFGYQVIVERVGGAEIGRRIAQFPDDIAEKRAVALEVFLDDAIVADQRESLGDDLAEIARVGQGLQIAFHAGGEDKFADAVDGRADALAFKDRAVG